MGKTITVLLAVDGVIIPIRITGPLSEKTIRLGQSHNDGEMADYMLSLREDAKKTLEVLPPVKVGWGLKVVFDEAASEWRVTGDEQAGG